MIRDNATNGARRPAPPGPIFLEPTKAWYEKVAREILQKPDGEENFENHLFAALYNRDTGFYGRAALRPNLWKRAPNGQLLRRKCRMSRREWIERFFPIVPKEGGEMRVIRAKPAQRRLEAAILRMERAGVPVRIQILKSRKQGISTWVQAVAFHAVLTGSHKDALIIGDTQERSEILINIMRIALSRIAKAPGGPEGWEFVYARKKIGNVAWSAPIDGSIRITSAEVDEPARGWTGQVVHMSEGGFWKEAEKKQLGVIDAVSMEPGTAIFDESTANGDQGTFRDNWWDYWPERDVPFRQRRKPWHTLFVAWFEDPDYRLTKSGREVSHEVIKDITETMTDEERWLLKQRYYERGRGWRLVDYDQLAWRRQRLADKGVMGDLDALNQEYPSRPEIAFRASGSPVFNPEKLAAKSRLTRQCVWRGSVEEPFAESAQG